MTSEIDPSRPKINLKPNWGAIALGLGIVMGVVVLVLAILQNEGLEFHRALSREGKPARPGPPPPPPPEDDEVPPPPPPAEDEVPPPPPTEQDPPPAPQE